MTGKNWKLGKYSAEVIYQNPPGSSENLSETKFDLRQSWNFGKNVLHR